MISSFGESGLPGFQAGHCDWQRPHSVQVEKSSRPFQENCSTWETPKTSSSPGSVKSIGFPPDVIGSSPPRDVAPSALRLNQMFGNARKRCQATPMSVLRATVIIQMKEVAIFRPAKKYVRFWRVETSRWRRAETTGYEMKNEASYASTWCWAPSSACSMKMQTPTMRM